MKLLNKTLLSVFAIIALGLAGCGHKEDVVKPSPLVSFTPVLKTQTVWSNHVNDGSGKETLKLIPAITTERIFAADYKGKITAVDRNTGKAIWSIKTKTPITSGVAAGSGLIFVGTGTGKVLALSQSDGQLKWQSNMLNEVLATPLYTQNTVIAKTESGQLSAFDAMSGKRLWNYTEEGPALVLRGSSAPRAFDGLVISGFASGELVALDVDSGNVVWKQVVAEPQGSFVVERMIDINADPIVADGTIYVATFQGKLAAVNARNGNIIWQKNISTYSGLAVDSSNVYISDANDVVRAFDRETGATKWKQTALANRGVTAPAAVGSYVVVGDAEGYLHWMAKANGNFVSRQRIDSNGIIVAPIAADGGIYVFSKSGRLDKVVE